MTCPGFNRVATPWISLRDYISISKRGWSAPTISATGTMKSARRGPASRRGDMSENLVFRGAGLASQQEVQGERDTGVGGVLKPVVVLHTKRPYFSLEHEE